MPSALPLNERTRIADFNLMVARTSHDIWWLYAANVTRRRFIEGMQPYSGSSDMIKPPISAR